MADRSGSSRSTSRGASTGPSAPARVRVAAGDCSEPGNVVLRRRRARHDGPGRRRTGDGVGLVPVDRRGGDQTITVDGASVPLYLPAGYDGKKIPLVLDLHGSSSSGLQQIAGDGIRAIADREGFAVLAPNGAVPFSPAPGFVGFAWNIPGVPLVGTTIYPPAGTRDDVQFLSHAIDVAGSVACIDSKQPRLRHRRVGRRPDGVAARLRPARPHRRHRADLRGAVPGGRRHAAEHRVV